MMLCIMHLFVVRAPRSSRRKSSLDKKMPDEDDTNKNARYGTVG